MKNSYTKLAFLAIILSLALSISCKKEEEEIIPKPDPMYFDSLIDSRDGIVYKTVVINNQEWMAENLKYKPISGNFWAYDDDTSNIATYGYLYDWALACTSCPSGWRLPNNDDWETYYNYIGGNEKAGGKMKEIGTSHWLSPNTSATNEAGFNGLPGGFRNHYDEFKYQGFFGYFWSISEFDNNLAYTKILYYNNAEIGGEKIEKTYGNSVRCIKE